MIDPTILAGITNAQTGLFPHTSFITRPTIIKNPNGLGTIPGPEELIDAGRPCRVTEKSSVVDVTGGTVKVKREVQYTTAAGLVLALGDRIYVDTASVALRLTVTRFALSTLATVSVIYCEHIEGS